MPVTHEASTPEPHAEVQGSMRIIYKGAIAELELTTTAAWVKVPQTDPAIVAKFGSTLAGAVSLHPGDDLPHRLALMAALREACFAKRQVEIYLNLAVVLDMFAVPPQPVPVDENASYQPFGRYQFMWVCERLFLRGDE